MKVKELIEELQKLSDEDKELLVCFIDEAWIMEIDDYPERVKGEINGREKEGILDYIRLG